MGLWDAWYRQGTVDVTNGDATVTGTLTTWTSQVKIGDTFLGPDGGDYEVLSVDSNTQITLTTDYAGSTDTGASYAIKRYSTGWNSVADLSLRIANFLQNVIGIYGGASVPSDGDGRADGSHYFRVDTSNSIAELYKKSGGTWGSPITLKGMQGAVGPAYATTSATSNTVGTGTKTFTIASGGLSYLGSRMRAARTSDPTKYLEGIVTAATGTTVTITSDNIGGSGTFSDWSLVVTGDKGAQGVQGPLSSGTSTTSNTVGTGTKTFTVAAGLDLALGQRLRFSDSADPATNWLEGSITAYSGTSLSVASDLTAGAGTLTSWKFGISGARGAQGVTGGTGADSTVPGPSYAATSATNSVTIGTGSKTLDIGTGYAYQAGARVRASDASNPTTKWIEGVCTAYASGNLTIAVDKTLGSGTPSGWAVSVVGEPGANGADGVSPAAVGDYSGPTVFSRGDIARDGGAAWQYINVTPGSGNAPPTLPTTSNSHWQLVAKDGVDGSGAVNSVNGQSGTVILGAEDIDVTGLDAAPSGASIENHLAALYGLLAPNPNILSNGDGFINSSSATTGADGAYHLNDWFGLSQTANFAVSVLSNVADGVPSMIRLTQNQATAQRIGSGQVLDGVVSRALRAQDVTISGMLRASAAATARYAILAWIGTEDAAPTDPVNSWTSSTFTPGNFFLASNIAVIAEGNIALAANTLTDFELSGSVPSNCNNIIVMAWSSATMAQTATMDFRAKLERGDQATDFVTDRPNHDVTLRGSGKVKWSSGPATIGLASGVMEFKGAPNGYTFDGNVGMAAGTGLYAGGNSQFTFSGSDIECSRHLWRGAINPALGTTSGWMCATSGNGHFASTSAPLYSNRIGTDGILLDVRRDGTSIGNLTCASGAVTLTAFSGSHWSRFGDGDYRDVLLGTILSAVPGIVRWKFACFTIDGVEIKTPYNGPAAHGETAWLDFYGDAVAATIMDEEPDNNLVKHVRVEVTSVAGAKDVYGVFAGYCDGEGWNDVLVTSVGNFWVRMAAGQTPQIGDLVEADANGCGVVQSDDVIRSKTVAKITNADPQRIYDDGSYLVPCVLYCG